MFHVKDNLVTTECLCCCPLSVWLKYVRPIGGLLVLQPIYCKNVGICSLEVKTENKKGCSLENFYMSPVDSRSVVYQMFHVVRERVAYFSPPAGQP